MKRLRILVIFVCACILVLNYTALPYLLNLKPVIAVYTYENALGQEIVEIPAKGSQIDFNHTSLSLKRNFKIKPWAVWMWHDYLFHPRWRIKYNNESG